MVFYVKMRYNKLVLDEIAIHFFFDGFLGGYISKSEFFLKKGVRKLLPDQPSRSGRTVVMWLWYINGMVVMSDCAKYIRL